MLAERIHARKQRPRHDGEQDAGQERIGTGHEAAPSPWETSAGASARPTPQRRVVPWPLT